MSAEFSGKCVIVTGGSSGIGEAIVRAFVDQGANVAYCGLRSNVGEALEAELADHPIGESWFQQCDVSNPAELEKFVTGAVDRFGDVDILVNNAGAKVAEGPAESTSLEGFESTLRTNLTSQFLLAKLVLPGMLARRDGAIINISSTMGLRGAPDHLAYAVSKGGIITLTQSLALDYARSGVRINCVAPGLVATPMTQDWIDQQSDLAGDKGIPMNRAGTGNEIADAVLFLAGPRATYITGVVLPVDGGLSVGE